MRGRGFPWSKLLMVLLVFVAGFIAHDVRSHGSFAGASESCVLKKNRPFFIGFFLFVFEIFFFTKCAVCVTDSTTALHLRSSGVTDVSQQAWSKVKLYSTQGFRYVLNDRSVGFSRHTFWPEAQRKLYLKHVSGSLHVRAVGSGGMYRALSNHFVRYNCILHCNPIRLLCHKFCFHALLFFFWL